MSKKCIECGIELDDGAVFCDECGAKQGEAKVIKLQSERNKLIEELEKTDKIGSSIGINEMLIDKHRTELSELKDKADGVNGKLLIIIGVIVLIGTIICFKKFGFIGGIVGFFICVWIGNIVEANLRKLLNIKKREEIELAKEEYLRKKVELEADIKKLEEQIRELASDVTYKKYAYLLKNEVHPFFYNIPKNIINALKEGKANTLEEAMQFSEK